MPNRTFGKASRIMSLKPEYFWGNQVFTFKKSPQVMRLGAASSVLDCQAFKNRSVLHRESMIAENSSSSEIKKRNEI